MFNDIITVYSMDPDETFKRTVIKGCMWSSETIKSIGGDGKLNISKVVNVTIPSSAVMSNKYIDFKEYLKLTDKNGYFTLNPTTNADVMVLGVCDTVPSADFSISTLVKEELSATVASVTDNTNNSRPHLKNIKVVGR